MTFRVSLWVKILVWDKLRQSFQLTAVTINFDRLMIFVKLSRTNLLHSFCQFTQFLLHESSLKMRWSEPTIVNTIKIFISEMQKVVHQLKKNLENSLNLFLIFLSTMHWLWSELPTRFIERHIQTKSTHSSLNYVKCTRCISLSWLWSEYLMDYLIPNLIDGEG